MSGVAARAAEPASRPRRRQYHGLRHLHARFPAGPACCATAGCRQANIAARSTCNARSHAQLINDLLDVSRIIPGKLLLNVEPVVSEDVVSTSLESIRPAADAKQIAVRAYLPPDPLVVAVDRDRLQQILWNLLTNAVKFTPQGGRVDISAAPRDGIVLIVVADSGAGISSEFLPFVFDRFRQGERGTTRSQPGLGLGLAIVRHLVELHGGTVEAHSAGAGTDALHHLEARLMPSNAGGGANGVNGPHGNGQHGQDGHGGQNGQSGQSGESLKGARLLIVDDDADAREMLTIALESSGAIVATASSAAHARQEAAARRPDVIIADIGMAYEDGYSLLRRMREQRQSPLATIPVIALTAYASEADRRREREAGFDAYLSKPVDLDALIDVLAGLVSR